MRKEGKSIAAAAGVPAALAGNGMESMRGRMPGAVVIIMISDAVRPESGSSGALQQMMSLVLCAIAS